LAEKALSLASAVARFGRTAARKLTEIAVQGEPEDQLRAPLEQLLSDLAELSRRRREHLTTTPVGSETEHHPRGVTATSPGPQG
jgi:hypothetical protein